MGDARDGRTGGPASWRTGLVLTACGAVTVGFHLYVAFSGLIPNLVTRPLHLALAIPWIYVLAPAPPADGFARSVRWLTAGVGIAACLYIVVERTALVRQYGALEGPLQYLVAVALIAVVLDMARRAIKAVLPAIAALVLLYGLFGQYIPGRFGHAGMPVDYFLGTLVITEGGLWGPLTGISVTVIALFIILGATISAGQAGTGFMAFATQLAGRRRAGPAKVAVISSALYGTISGVAAANTASTGMVTIPAMKRLGYPPKLAAAVEAVASSGGQIMPPIMGAGVFVMAELLRTSYASVMVAATLPAMLFFLAAWVGVHNFALRYDLRSLSTADLPGWPLVARTVPFFLVPFGILVAMLVFSDATLALAAVYATVASWLLLAFDAGGGPSLDGWLRRSADALVQAGRQIATIAAIIVCAGLIVGVFNMTGLGVKLSSVILSLSGGELWAALLLTALASLVLGMELPTTAAYVICVAVAGPALTALGLPELTVHLFVFWYALLCTITPPVCGNVFIAAGIAETPWLPVAFTAMRLGLGLFLVPLGFVSHPSLLALAGDPGLALLAAAKLAAGLWLVSFAVIGPPGRSALRVPALAAGLALLLLYGF